jgi:hypothetical protein
MMGQAGAKIGAHEGIPSDRLRDGVTNAGNVARQRMAAMVQEDLAGLGIKINMVKQGIALSFDPLGLSPRFRSNACAPALNQLDGDGRSCYITPRDGSFSGCDKRSQGDAECDILSHEIQYRTRATACRSTH